MTFQPNSRRHVTIVGKISVETSTRLDAMARHHDVHRPDLVGQMVQYALDSMPAPALDPAGQGIVSDAALDKINQAQIDREEANVD